MELYQAEDNYIIQDKDSSLWCSRVDGKLVPQPGKVKSEAREMPLHCQCSGTGGGSVSAVAEFCAGNMPV